MGEEKNTTEAEQKALLAAGMLLGVLATLGGIVKAAMEQSEKAKE